MLAFRFKFFSYSIVGFDDFQCVCSFDEF